MTVELHTPIIAPDRSNELAPVLIQRSAADSGSRNAITEQLYRAGLGIVIDTKNEDCTLPNDTGSAYRLTTIAKPENLCFYMGLFAERGFAVVGGDDFVMEGQLQATRYPEVSLDRTRAYAFRSATPDGFRLRFITQEKSDVVNVDQLRTFVEGKSILAGHRMLLSSVAEAMGLDIPAHLIEGTPKNVDDQLGYLKKSGLAPDVIGFEIISTGRTLRAKGLSEVDVPLVTSDGSINKLETRINFFNVTQMSEYARGWYREILFALEASDQPGERVPMEYNMTATQYNQNRNKIAQYAAKFPDEIWSGDRQFVKIKLVVLPGKAREFNDWMLFSIGATDEVTNNFVPTVTSFDAKQSGVNLALFPQP